MSIKIEDVLKMIEELIETEKDKPFLYRSRYERIVIYLKKCEEINIELIEIEQLEKDLKEYLRYESNITKEELNKRMENIIKNIKK